MRRRRDGVKGKFFEEGTKERKTEEARRTGMGSGKERKESWKDGKKGRKE